MTMPNHQTLPIDDVEKAPESDSPATGKRWFRTSAPQLLLFHVLLLFHLPATTDGLSTTSSAARKQQLSTNQQSLSEQPASFPRTWVPLASTRELDPTRATPVYFLNNRYVMYRSVIGQDEDDDQWMVLDDACPHRLAPLSQGRVTTTTTTTSTSDDDQGAATVVLECSYHGWRFDADGHCIRIPQVTDEVQQKLMTAAKCHATSYSTRIVNDILFFWPWEEDCLSALEDEWKQPEAMLNGVVPTGGTYTRDLPYGWEALVENIVDPSHVPFVSHRLLSTTARKNSLACTQLLTRIIPPSLLCCFFRFFSSAVQAHHGLQGRREDAIPINMTMLEAVSPRGFRFIAEDRTMGERRRVEGAFRAPYVIQYGGTFTGTAKPFALTALLIPTKPGWSRITLLTQRSSDVEGSGGGDATTTGDETAAAASKPPPSIARTILQKVLPVWFIHQLSNVFLDSDLAFLHFQELEIERRKSFDSFMPAEADTCIVAWRKWLKEYGIAYTSTGGTSTTELTALPHSVLFDRYEQHTQHCRHCRAALEGARSNRRIAVGGLMASLLLWQVVEPPLAQVGAIASIGVIAVTSVMEKSFREGGFDHATND